VTKARLQRIALGIAALISLATAASCEYQFRRVPELRRGLRPLRVDISPGERTVRRDFVPTFTEPHNVAITFNAPTDPELAARLKKASASLGRYGPAQAPFDFEWTVSRGGAFVGYYSGLSNPTGDSSFQEITSLAFGSFEAAAGITYTIEVKFGPAADALLRASPRIDVEVGVAGPSLALAIDEELARPFAAFFLAVGIVAAFLAFRAR
jgi:hypothetical protein